MSTASTIMKNTADMGLVGTFPLIKLENETCEAMATVLALLPPPSFLFV